MPHVFISYSHKDLDWVEAFDDQLTKALASYGGGITTWRDRHKLRNGDRFDEEIEANVAGAVFFIAVISGAWKASEYCQKELATFIEDPAHKGRLGCAITLPGDGVELPESLAKVHQTRFFRVQKGRKLENAPTTQTFRQAVLDLAADISAKVVVAPQAALISTVTEARLRVAAGIQAECGTMRILGMSSPVEIGGIYTDVHILEELSSQSYLGAEEITPAYLREGRRKKDKRISGKVAVLRHQRLLILGPPGAGKSTFLKRLAMECSTGAFLPDKMPVFVGLKEFSDRTDQPTLLQFVEKQAGPRVQEILRGGQALVLLDGLDEVAEQHFNRVRDGIDHFTKTYSRCIVVLTCRIAAKQYVFPRFTEVEMAEFTPEQIATFARNWFTTKQLPHKMEPFLEKVKDEAIQELARSPLLLTMLCLLFEKQNEFASDRASIYRGAFETLLKEWDGTRGHVRASPYKGLGLEEKQNLLGEIAYQRFVDDEYFFEQDSLAEQIASFFADRPSLLAQGETLDAKVILNAIESQHGLLVRRSTRYYSFSHLTFQEYLTARQIQADPQLWGELGPCLGDSRWRGVLARGDDGQGRLFHPGDETACGCGRDVGCQDPGDA